MNSNSNVKNINNNSNNFYNKNNLKNVKNNQNISININNNTNYFNFNINPSINQFFSNYEKVPRKRSHNIPTSNFSTGMLEQIANSSGIAMYPSLNSHFNNFMNSSNFYGKIPENLGNMSNIGGIARRLDIPSMSQFSNFSPYNFPSNNSLPVIKFNNNNNITTAPAPALNFGSNGIGFFSNVNNNNNDNPNSNANYIFGNNNHNNSQGNFYSTNSFNGNINNCNNGYGKFNLFNQDYVPFTCKLHNNILDYLNDVNKIVEVLKPIKLNVIANIEKMLKQFLDYEITIDVFGSFANDLSIESSDIDLKVNILNENSDSIDYDWIIFSLVNFFKEKKVFENATPIHTASIPIIKLVI
jgi:predicted nucleotidyltransferase